jgi:hypothetical protein
MDCSLSQIEVDALLAMEKCRVDDTNYTFPELGGSLKIPLKSKDEREEFLLDVSRGRIALKKHTFQIRTRLTCVLARVDIAGAPHRNPDGEEIACPHIHIHRHGADDKWAIPLPSEIFANPENAMQVLEDFMDFCNISEKPIILRDLLHEFQK